MIEKKVYPLDKSVRLIYKAYILLIVGFGAWAYIHGHLSAYAYQQELGVLQFSVPVDITKTEIYGGIQIFLKNLYFIVATLIVPVLAVCVHWILFKHCNGNIRVNKWWVNSNHILSFLMISFTLIVLVIPWIIIKRPIDEGIENARNFIEKPDCEIQEVLTQLNK